MREKLVKFRTIGRMASFHEILRDTIPEFEYLIIISF